MIANIIARQVVASPDGRMDTKNASAFLGLSVKTLAMMRTQGTGPKFIKRGRIFYFVEDLEGWVAENPRIRTTAQARLVG
jgi:hypothetical protein